MAQRYQQGWFVCLFLNSFLLEEQIKNREECACQVLISFYLSLPSPVSPCPVHVLSVPCLCAILVLSVSCPFFVLVLSMFCPVCILCMVCPYLIHVLSMFSSCLFHVLSLSYLWFVQVLSMFCPYTLCVPLPTQSTCCAHYEGLSPSLH